MKKSIFKSSAFYYHLFTTIALLELTASILGVIFGFSDATRDTSISNIFLSSLVIVLMSVPRFLKSKFKLVITNSVEILVLVFLFASITLGFVHNFYEDIYGYDKIVHAVSGFVIALSAFEAIHIYNQNSKKYVKLPAIFVSIFAFTFSITLLVVWEFYEFLIDTLTFNLTLSASNMQRYMWENTYLLFPQDYGLLDTMLDLIVGAIGSLIICILGYHFLKKQESNNTEKLA
jgi:hypothetical protein